MFLFLYLLYYSMVVILEIYTQVYINSYIQVVTETNSKLKSFLTTVQQDYISRMKLLFGVFSRGSN